MKFQRYDSLAAFENAALDTLMENEAQNNLPISFLQYKDADVSSWLLATVSDDAGGVLLTAACTPPFGVTLYETGNRMDNGALLLFIRELRAIGFELTGVNSESGLARRFARIYAGEGNYTANLKMNVMRLDEVIMPDKAPGHMRPLAEEDLFFAPHWERAFSEDCGTEVYTILRNYDRLRARLGRDVHYFWEDRVPVSQAAHGRSIVNGAVVNSVYTPPQYRGRGYATSLVAQLSQTLLERGHKFCCLFADADNPVSCGIYRKLGYRDICVCEVIAFTESGK